MTDKKWLDSKKVKNGLAAMLYVVLILALFLWAAAGDPEKFKLLLEAAKMYVMAPLGVLGVATAGQAGVDIKAVK